MYPVPFNKHIDGCVDLDTGHFRAAKQAFGPDVINMIIGNLTENATQ